MDQLDDPLRRKILTFLKVQRPEIGFECVSLDFRLRPQIFEVGRKLERFIEVVQTRKEGKGFVLNEFLANGGQVMNFELGVGCE